MTHINSRINGFNFGPVLLSSRAQAEGSLSKGHISWRSYNVIKKKAMEQEFSWSGLFISLSIAFFVVVGCATALNLIHHSIIQKENGGANSPGKKIYQLENKNYLNAEVKNIYKNYLA